MDRYSYFIDVMIDEDVSQHLRPKMKKLLKRGMPMSITILQLPKLEK